MPAKRRRYPEALLAAFLVALLTSGAVAATADPAPLFRHGPNRGGFLATGPQPPLELAWKLATRHGALEIESFPAVDDGLSPAVAENGIVYAGGHDGFVYALDATGGGKRWEFRTGGRINSAPAISDGVLFVGSTDGFLYALDARTGQRLWQTTTGTRTFRQISYQGIRSSPVVQDGVVYVGGCDGRIRALEAATGRILWVVDAGTEGCYSSPAVVGHTLFVGTDGLTGSALFALDPRTGAVRWKFSTPTQIFSTPAVVDGTVYFHARDDHIYALHAADGALRWKTPAPWPQDPFRVFVDMSKSSPAVGAQRLFVGVGKELLALDTEGGAVLWRFATRGKVDSSPLIVGPTVYVGSDDHTMYAVDASSGRSLWTFRTGGRVSTSPQVGAGLLLWGADDGVLYAFRHQP